MIDFHNHILPNVDDGSKSLEMSLNMLRHAADQGITDVVNTVHFQHPKVETEDISFDRIQGEIGNLQVELDLVKTAHEQAVAKDLINAKTKFLDSMTGGLFSKANRYENESIWNRNHT